MESEPDCWLGLAQHVSCTSHIKVLPPLPADAHPGSQQADGSSTWSPVTHVEDLDGVPGSLLSLA